MTRDTSDLIAGLEAMRAGLPGETLRRLEMLAAAEQEMVRADTDVHIAICRVRDAARGRHADLLAALSGLAADIGLVVPPLQVGGPVDGAAGPQPPPLEQRFAPPRGSVSGPPPDSGQPSGSGQLSSGGHGLLPPGLPRILTGSAN